MKIVKLESLQVEKKEEYESPLLETPQKDRASAKKEQIVVTKLSFWDRFLLKLSVEEKAVIAENIIDEMESSPLYWILLVTSVVIAALGLLQNSVAIIIGAMLLAPLLRPIKGLAFGITTGQPAYFWKALKMLLLSILFAVGTAYLISLMVPLKIETTEILARTAPNLLDLLIAIAAAIIAILSLYFKKLSENIAGVAMAAAILPPLAVTGIELSLGNMGAVLGSFFLFVTNLFAILAVGVSIFLIYGFFPAQENLKHRTINIAMILFLMLAFISFPLAASLRNIADKVTFQSQGFQIFQESLQNRYPSVQLEYFKVNKLDDKMVEFSGKLKVPSDVDFVAKDQEVVRRKLVRVFGREVDIEFEVVPTISIRAGE